MKQIIGIVVALGVVIGGTGPAFALNPKDVVRLQTNPCSPLRWVENGPGLPATQVCVTPRRIHAGEGVYAELVYRIWYRDGTDRNFNEYWGVAYDAGTLNRNLRAAPFAGLLGNVSNYGLWLSAGYNLHVVRKTFLGITYKVTATMLNILGRSARYNLAAPFIPMPDFTSVKSVTDSIFSSFDFDTLFNWSKTIFLEPWRLDRIADVEMRPWELVTDMHRIASAVFPTPEQVIEGFEHLDVTRGMRAPQIPAFLKNSPPLGAGQGGAISKMITARLASGQVVNVPVNMIYYKGPTTF